MSRNIQGIIIQILQTWYATQTFIVQCGNCLPDYLLSQMVSIKGGFYLHTYLMSLGHSKSWFMKHSLWMLCQCNHAQCDSQNGLSDTTSE